MKKLLILCLFFTGCVGNYNIKAGDCFASSQYDAVLRVNEVMQYGVAVSYAFRESSVATNKKAKEVFTGYVAFDTLRDNPKFMTRIDCAFFNEVTGK